MRVALVCWVWCLVSHCLEVQGQEDGLGHGRELIAGGGIANMKWFNWVGSIQYVVDGKKQHVCGASLISATTALTTASCLADGYYEDVVFNMNTLFDNSRKRVVRKIAGVLFHNKFDLVTRNNDIALIYFDEPVGSLPFVTLDTTGEVAAGDSKALVLGWGVSKRIENIMQPKLRSAEVDMYSQSQCKLYFPESLVTGRSFTESMVCGGGNGRGVCFGDFGGPLYDARNKKLVGLSSWTASCGEDASPSIFTMVYKYSDWIQGNMENPGACTHGMTRLIANDPHKMTMFDDGFVRYPNNGRVCVQIEAPNDGEKVKVLLSQVDTELDFDFVKVFRSRVGARFEDLDEETDMLATLSGFDENVTEFSGDSAIMIVLESDDSMSGNGFQGSFLLHKEGETLIPTANPTKSPTMPPTQTPTKPPTLSTGKDGYCPDGLTLINLSKLVTGNSWFRFFGYPDLYPSGVQRRCWLITSGDEGSVELNFLNLRIRGGDEVNVYTIEGNSIAQQNLRPVARFGPFSDKPEDAIVGPSIVITFSSDDEKWSVYNHLFNAAVRKVDKSAENTDTIPTPAPTTRNVFCRGGMIKMEAPSDGTWATITRDMDLLPFQGEDICWHLEGPNRYRGDLTLEFLSIDIDPTKSKIQVYRSTKAGNPNPKFHELMETITTASRSGPYSADNLVLTYNAARMSKYTEHKGFVARFKATGLATNDVIRVGDKSFGCDIKMQTCKTHRSPGLLYSPCTLDDPCKFSECKSYCNADQTCVEYEFLEVDATSSLGICELYSSKSATKPRNEACHEYVKSCHKD